MKVKLFVAAIAAVLTASVAQAASANWTGRMESVQTVTGKYAYNCEYDYYGQKFWRVFVGHCPSRIEVE